MWQRLGKLTPTMIGLALLMLFIDGFILLFRYQFHLERGLAIYLATLTVALLGWIASHFLFRAVTTGPEDEQGTPGGTS